MSIEKVGARLYFTGDTFAARVALKRLGAHWDGDAKAWWIGVAKRADAEALVASLSAPVMAPTPASARAAESVGLAPDAPAGIVADKLRDEGREAQAAAVAKAPEDVSDCRVYAQVEYQGRRYYVIAEQRTPATATQVALPLRCRIATLDGEAPRWVDCAACTLVRTYEGRPERGAYGRPTGRTVYTTIGSLRDFRDRQRQGERDGLPQCAACRKRSAHLVHDLEDGLMKCRGCADFPFE